jgi:hypothetical protein
MLRSRIVVRFPEYRRKLFHFAEAWDNRRLNVRQTQNNRAARS